MRMLLESLLEVVGAPDIKRSVSALKDVDEVEHLSLPVCFLYRCQLVYHARETRRIIRTVIQLYLYPSFDNFPARYFLFH